uniref:Uncharacterized protein n=1 Tax=Glossina pallidipes TaxID=7398 RepID=A0A1A9ZCX1_GLOPL
MLLMVSLLEMRKAIYRSKNKQTAMLDDGANQTKQQKTKVHKLDLPACLPAAAAPAAANSSTDICLSTANLCDRSVRNFQFPENFRHDELKFSKPISRLANGCSTTAY